MSRAGCASARIAAAPLTRPKNSQGNGDFLLQTSLRCGWRSIAETLLPGLTPFACLGGWALPRTHVLRPRRLPWSTGGVQGPQGSPRRPQGGPAWRNRVTCQKKWPSSCQISWPTRAWRPRGSASRDRGGGLLAGWRCHPPGKSPSGKFCSDGFIWRCVPYLRPRQVL